MQYFGGVFHLGIHQIAKSLMIFVKKRSNRCGGCVFSVGSAKSIIDINVTVFGQFSCKVLVSFFLFRIKSQIFKQEDFSSFESGGFAECIIAYAVVCKFYRSIREIFAEGRDDVTQ